MVFSHGFFTFSTGSSSRLMLAFCSVSEELISFSKSTSSGYKSTFTVWRILYVDRISVYGSVMANIQPGVGRLSLFVILPDSLDVVTVFAEVAYNRGVLERYS